MTKRPPLSAIIVFALGQFGWSLGIYSIANLMVYFYMPPEEGGVATFPAFINQNAVLLGLTVVGLLAFGGRIFDAFIDPAIAGYSDRKKSKMGKRKSLMAIAAFPFALFSFLVFYPLSAESFSTNTGFLIFAVVGFYFFYTLYVIPYNALIAELGHHPDDRLKISTIISVTFALGLILGSQVYAFQEILEQYYDPVYAFQLVIAGFSLLAFVLMMIPVLFLNENKYAKQEEQSVDTFKSLGVVLQDKNFRYFLISDAFYWLAVSFIQLGIIYYMTILFQYEKGKASEFLALSFVGSFIMYFLVYWLTPRVGKRVLFCTGFVVFALAFLLSYFIPILNMDKELIYYMLIILAAFPLAVFGILPNVIIADAVNLKEAETGESQAGMYFGVRNFLSKLGISMANLIFPSLLIFGYTIEMNAGVRYTCLAAAVFCMIGLFSFLGYKEIKN